MTLPKIPSRRSIRIVLAALALAPGVARAQLDDPGLGAPPPPPPPTKTDAPAATPPAKGAEATTPPATTPAPPAAAPGQETLVREDVKEEVKEVYAQPVDDNDWEAQRAAPSLYGPVGLFRTQTAEVGKPLSLRVGLHLQGFSQDSFLVAGSGTTAGDSNSNFKGDLMIGLTGPDVTFLRGLELYLGIFNASNQNKRPDPGRTDPTVILSLADVAVGLHGGWKVVKSLHLGANFGVRFYNSIADVAANFDATTIDVNGIATFDVRELKSNVPVRLHLNIGYINDNSLKLLPSGQCANSTGNDSCIRSRVVETFAYGLNNSRVRLAFALDLPLRIHASPSYIFGIEPFAEWHLDAATSSGDSVVGNALGAQATTDQLNCGTDAACLSKVSDFRNRISNTVSQYMTVGVRFRPVSRLVVDIGADFALVSPGFQYGPPIPRYNIVGGLAYAFDAGGTKTKQITRNITKVYEVNRRPATGKIAGVVLDAKTKKPIPGAVVKYSIRGVTSQVAGDDGKFISAELPPGMLQVEASAADYEPETAKVGVTQDGLQNVQLSLKAAPPKEGKVKIRVTDDKLNPLPGATARLVGANTTKEAVFENDALTAQAPAGEYTVTIEAPGFLSKDKQVTIKPAAEESIDVSLSKRPKQSHVEIKQNEIIIKGTVHFANNEATILPDGQQILNEVVDVLSKNPQLRKISIEGHTDNNGDANKNLQLSKDRAKAVVDYMVKNGIHAERLVSEGYGQTKPIVPNVSAANRAKNRRVEFKIVEQGAAGGSFTLPQ